MFCAQNDKTALGCIDCSIEKSLCWLFSHIMILKQGIPTPCIHSLIILLSWCLKRSTSQRGNLMCHICFILRAWIFAKAIFSYYQTFGRHDVLILLMGNKHIYTVERWLIFLSNGFCIWKTWRRMARATYCGLNDKRNICQLRLARSAWISAWMNNCMHNTSWKVVTYPLMLELKR